MNQDKSHEFGQRKLLCNVAGCSSNVSSKHLTLCDMHMTGSLKCCSLSCDNSADDNDGGLCLICYQKLSKSYPITVTNNSTYISPTLKSKSYEEFLSKIDTLPPLPYGSGLNYNTDYSKKKSCLVCEEETNISELFQNSVCKKCYAIQHEYLSNFKQDRKSLNIKCVNNKCKFFGNPETNNYCSECFKNSLYEEPTGDENAVFVSKTLEIDEIPQKTTPMPKSYERMAQEATELGLQHIIYKDIKCLRPRQKLISFMYSSRMNNRSPFKVTCMMFGQSGSGKTTFINHLIGSELLKTNPVCSETRDIQEIILTMDDPTLGVSNLQLTIVDTPGYFDDKGCEEDERNHRAILKYKEDKLGDYYPNLIIIVIQGCINRFNEEHPFVKCLEKLRETSLIDLSYNNVICLFTYASTFLNYPEDFKKKKTMLIDLCKRKLDISVSVCYVENDLTNLKTNGDWTVLSDGTKQPLNVFYCAKDIMKGGNKSKKDIDPLGLATFARFFSGKSGYEITAEVFLFQDSYRGYKEIKQPQLNVRKSISGQICVGKGYDVFLDEIKTCDIFETGETEEQLGFEIKKGLNVISFDKEESIFYGADMKSYVSQRLKDVGLTGIVDPELLKFEKKPGVTFSGDLRPSSLGLVFSYLHEVRKYNLQVADTKSLKLNDALINDVMSNDFPSVYIIDNPIHTEFFKNFFKKWGHYVITSAFLGGYVELTITDISVYNKDSNEKMNHILNVGLGMLRHGNQYNIDSGAIPGNDVLPSNIKLNWVGGTLEHEILELSKANSRIFTNWEKSLTVKPSVLNANLKLQSIADIVARLNCEKGIACQKALDNFLGISKLKQVSKKKKTTERVDGVIEVTRLSAAAAAEPTPKCFSGNGKTVTMKNRPKITLVKDLGVGDEVLSFDITTKKLIFSRVYMIAHKNETEKSDFLNIFCDDGNEVTLSHKHLIYTNSFRVKYADQIQIGDGLWTNNFKADSQSVNLSKVVAINRITSVGFYAPFTMCGNILVNGVLSSCYADVKDVILPVLGKISGQEIAHFGTLPLRSAYCLCFRNYCKILNDEEMPKCIKRFMNFGKKTNLVFKS